MTNRHSECRDPSHAHCHIMRELPDMTTDMNIEDMIWWEETIREVGNVQYVRGFTVGFMYAMAVAIAITALYLAVS